MVGRLSDDYRFGMGSGACSEPSGHAVAYFVAIGFDGSDHGIRSDAGYSEDFPGFDLNLNYGTNIQVDSRTVAR